MNPDDRTCVSDALQEHGFIRDWEQPRVRRSGEVFTVLVSSDVIMIAGEKMVITSLLDITERKLAEEALRVSNEKFTKAFAASPVGIALSRGRDGLIMEVNDTWLSMFGYTREEVIEKTSLDLQFWPSPEDRAHAAAELSEKGFYHNREQKMLTRSGKSVVMLGSADIILIAGEEMILATWLDITDRKRVEQDRENLLVEVQRRAAELDAIFSSVINGLVVNAPDGRVLSANPAAQRILQMPPAQWNLPMEPAGRCGGSTPLMGKRCR